MAANTDLFLEVGIPGTATNLGGSGYTIGASSITVDTTSGWPTGTGVIFGIDVVETDSAGNEVRVDGSYNIFAGVVTSATTIGSLDQIFGDAQNYSAGASTRVYITISSEHTNRMVQGLLVQHTQTGAHGNITATGFVQTTGTHTVPANSIPAAALETSAVTLSSVSSSTSQSGISTSPVLLSGLTSTVTIPAGGRRVRVEVLVPSMSSNNVAGFKLYIYNAATVTGTAIQKIDVLQAITGANVSGYLFYEYTPSAGSQSYCAAISCDTGTAATTLTATQLAYLTVKVL